MSTAFVDVASLSKTLQRCRGLLSRSVPLRAVVDDVTFAIEEGATFGLVGESGSGKKAPSPRS